MENTVLTMRHGMSGIASTKRDAQRLVSKEVKIQLVPEVKLINKSESQAAILDSTQVQFHKTNSKWKFQIFFANITSFSKKACDFLFTLPSEVKMILLAEVHKESTHVLSKFQKNRYFPSYNPPTIKNEGTHGGELVATRAYLQARSIQHEILSYIKTQFGSLHFAAKILTLHKVEVLVVSVYLWCSEGFSERNNTILHTIAILQQILNLPVICFGDFNVTYEEFAQSGWCERLKVSLIHPNVKTTTTQSSNRVIDFGFISLDIKLLFESSQGIKQVTWGPHIGILSTFIFRPKSIFQRVQCIPKSLPMATFVLEWNKLTRVQQDLVWFKSCIEATHLLTKHKNKTGVAILGKPDTTLNHDPKFQDDLRKAQIVNGEQLALAALSSELLVLSVANIPKNQHKLYTGRSQYPKFSTKPVIKDTSYNEFCPHLNYWSKIKQLATHTRREYSDVSANREIKDSITKALSEALFFADFHTAKLTTKLADEALILHRLVLSHDEYTLSRIHDSICDIHKVIVNKTMNEINSKWNKHVREQLSLGGGVLFKFISKLDKQFLNVSWDTHGKNASSPDMFLQQQVEEWSKYWNPDSDGNPNDEVLAEEYRYFRNAALEHSKGIMFGVPELELALKGYKKETKGIDVWKPSELRSLPEVAKSKLATSIQTSLQNIAAPHQNLISLNPLLGKPNKSCRTICKTPVLYRMALRADTTVKEWEASNCQSYDKATIGSSALLAALKRNLTAEVAVWLGKRHATVLNDYEKFFDTLDVKQLMVEAVFTEFPLGQLAFALQQHMAPRVLQANGCSSKSVKIHKSILAGCKFSVAMTRVYLQRGMKQLCKDHPGANPELFVDDTTLNASGETNADVLSVLVPAMISFKKIVSDLNLKLSPKGAIVASTHKLNAWLSRKLAKHGLKFTNSKHARDLGVSHAAGKARPGKLLHDRLKKSKHRISKISNLAKISKKSRKLFTGSAFTVATWGHQACGIAESKIVELERDALSCSGLKPAGRCRTFALLATYGVLGTPRARLIRETMRAWFAIVRNLQQEEVLELRAAWAKAKEPLTSHSSPICKVRGLMTNVMYILLQAKWVPVAYNVWRDNKNNIWSVTNFKVSPDIIASEIYHTFLSFDFQRASNHHNGGGIQHGVDLTHTFRYPRNIKDDSDVDYQFKAALNSVIAGCCWSSARINSINSNYSAQCSRCGHDYDDDLHTYWTCPHTQKLDHEFITKSNTYVNNAVEGCRQFPCLWFRGILPSELTSLPDSAAPVASQQLLRLGHSEWNSGTYYGDASGGTYTKYKMIRRVGCAVVCVDTQGEVLQGVYTPLPGEIQTVGRGELYALLLLVQQLQPLAEVEFVTDNFNVYKTYNKGPKAAKNSNNCDLFSTIFRLQYEKAIKIAVRWMPSHLGKQESDARPGGVSHLDVLANDRADHYAGEAAKSVQVSDPIATNHIYYIKLLKAIQRRLAVVIINLPKREKCRDEKPAPVPRLKLGELIVSTSHTILQKANRIHCSKCKCNFAMNDPACKHWLQTACSGFTESLEASAHNFKPIKVDISLHRGNSNTHSSHELFSYRGLVYCSRCGVRAGKNQFRLLAKPCEAIKSYGEYVLNCISNNRLPTGLTRWPDQDL